MRQERAFDPSAESWKGSTSGGSGAFQCRERLMFAREGRIMSRVCGRCSGCMARAKNDRAARLHAQVHVSAEVYGLTLTFAPLVVQGPVQPGRKLPVIEPDSVLKWSAAVKEWQLMMKRVRKQVWRDTVARLGYTERQLRRFGRGLTAKEKRLSAEDRAALEAELLELVLARKAEVNAACPVLSFCRVGEKGGRKGRMHWHAMVFADKPVGWVASERMPPKKHQRRGELKRENRPDFWPNGFMTLDKLPGGRAVEHVRQYDVQDIIRMQRSAALAHHQGVAVPEADRPETVDTDEAYRLGRYIWKYLEKSRGLSRSDRVDGTEPDVVYGLSNRNLMGSEWIFAEARRCAEAGLPYHGTYTVPGVRLSRASNRSKKTGNRQVVGNSWAAEKIVAGGALRTGNAEVDAILRQSFQAMRTDAEMSIGAQSTNCVFGRTKQRAIDAYKARWRELYGESKPPMTKFIQFADLERAEDEYAHPKVPPVEWRERDADVLTVKSLPPYRDKAREAWFVVFDLKGRSVGAVRVYDTGAARFSPADQGARPYFLPEGDLSLHLPMLDQRTRQAVEAKLVAMRGPGWLSALEYKAALDRILAARDAAVARAFPREEMSIRADLPPIVENTAVWRNLKLYGSQHHAAARAAEGGPSGSRRQGRVAALPRDAHPDLVWLVSQGARPI